jgi:hypothetical protein
MSLLHAQERYDGRDMQQALERKNSYRLMVWKTQAEKILGMRDFNYLEDGEVGAAHLKGS